MRHFMFGLLLVTLCGCEDPAAPFLVTTSLSRSSMRAGDTVMVTVTVQNTTDKSQLIPNNQCGFVFEVTNQAGSLVGPQGVFCSAVLYPPITLAGGAHLTWTQAWTGGSVNSEPSGPLQMVPLGSYIVVGEVTAEMYGKTHRIPATLTITP